MKEKIMNNFIADVPPATYLQFQYVLYQMTNDILFYIFLIPENKCAETMKNYQFCDGKIYSTNAKGVFFFPSV